MFVCVLFFEPQAKQLQDELTFVLRSSSASANAPASTAAGTAAAPTSTHIEASGINNLGTKQLDHTTVGGGKATAVDTTTTTAAAASAAAVAAAVTKSAAGSTGHANSVLGTSVSTTAITGSTRSTSSVGAVSVASESFGSIEIIHEEGLNSAAAGGGEAYLEVSKGLGLPLGVLGCLEHLASWAALRALRVCLCFTCCFEYLAFLACVVVHGWLCICLVFFLWISHVNPQEP